jgi:hypothetical protein
MIDRKGPGQGIQQAIDRRGDVPTEISVHATEAIRKPDR